MTSALGSGGCFNFSFINTAVRASDVLLLSLLNLKNTLDLNLKSTLGHNLKNTLGHNLKNILGHNLKNTLGHNFKNTIGLKCCGSTTGSQISF